MGRADGELQRPDAGNIQRSGSGDDLVRERLRADLLRATLAAREGDLDEAQRVLSTARDSTIQTFGSHSLEYADTLVTGVRIDASAGCPVSGSTEEHLRRAAVLDQAAKIQEELAAAPKLRLDTLRLLSTCLSRAGRRDESEAVLQTRLELAQVACGPAHVDTGFTAWELAVAVSLDQPTASRERLETARSGFDRAIAIAKGQLQSPEDARRAKLLYYMASDHRYDILARLEREAEGVEESLAAVRLELTDYEQKPMTPGPIFRCRNLAVALARLGRSADALPLLARAISEMRESNERSWDKMDEDQELLSRLAGG